MKEMGVDWSRSNLEQGFRTGNDVMSKCHHLNRNGKEMNIQYSLVGLAASFYNKK